MTSGLTIHTFQNHFTLYFILYIAKLKYGLRFMELAVLLEPSRPPKTDKSGILVDAVRVVTQLRDEAQKLKDSNLDLQEKIKELKASICYVLSIGYQIVDKFCQFGKTI